jgi:hypothetical protein
MKNIRNNERRQAKIEGFEDYRKITTKIQNYSLNYRITEK